LEVGDVDNRPYFRSLRGKITNRVLLIGILPILVVGSIAWFSLNQLTTDVSRQLQQSHNDLLDKVVGANLTAISKSVVQQLDSFMLERISDVVVWASAPTVVEATKTAAVLHQNQGLVELGIDDIEARFQDRKSMNVSPEANRYLIKQIERSQHFGEVFFTDSNGFNTALTNPTSDFVQRDENWWKTAWENGISVGEVEFDDSAGIWSIDISVRIDDPQSGESLGVMKAVLGVSLIQEVADAWAVEITEGTVTVVNSDGLLLAESATQHAQDRIMNGEVNLRNSDNPNVQQAFSNQPQGYAIGDQRVLGYAKSAGSDLYGSVVAKFQGFNWSVLVQQPTNVALAPIQGLSSIQNTLVDSRQRVVYVLAAVVGIVFVLAIIMARILARGITVPLFLLREHAEAVSRGDVARRIRVNSDDEIEDLAVDLDRLRASVAIILKRYKVLKNKVG
jgi:HAMP domain-containing protein